MLHPAIVFVFSWVLTYCKSNKLPCKITSIMSDRIGVVSESTTHQDGRAFDLSLHGISDFHKARIVAHANKIFKKIGAVSSKTGEVIVAYDKPHGTGPHIHFQIRPNADIMDVLLNPI